MNNRTADWLSFALVCIPVALAAWLWPTLPDPMPSHWNAAGEVDGYMPKFQGVALLPLVAAGTWGLMKLIPLVSPKGFRTDTFANVMNIFQVTMVAFMALVAVLVLMAASGIDVRMNQMVFAGCGIMLAVIGNYLSKVRKNFFVGFKTPWTLASDEVWNRTHRLGGKLYVAAGVVMVIGSLFSVPSPLVIGLVITLGLYPMLHSYFLYRRIEGFKEAPENGAAGSGD
jgi:uncharacterized membrane protein